MIDHWNENGRHIHKKVYFSQMDVVNKCLVPKTLVKSGMFKMALNDIKTGQIKRGKEAKNCQGISKTHPGVNKRINPFWDFAMKRSTILLKSFKVNKNI